MGRPSTELFGPCGSVHQQMQPEQASDLSTQQQFQKQQNLQTGTINPMQAAQFPPQYARMMPLPSAPQYDPQNLADPGQIPQANQSFGAEPTLYSGYPIPMSSQVQAGFEPWHPVPGFITGPTHSPAQPFPTAGANYSQAPFHLPDAPPMPQGVIVQLPRAAPPSPWTTGLFDCMDDPLNGTSPSAFPVQVYDIVDTQQLENFQVFLVCLQRLWPGASPA